jgi:cyanuric acid amidohydrolase
MAVIVDSYDTAHPGDTSDLAMKLAALAPARIRRLALLVKTEGNSDVNDYSREYAMLAAEQTLRKHGGDALVERTTFLISTGCEGAMTPFGYLFSDYDDPDARVPNGGRALAMGCARSRSLTPDEIGTPAHARMTAETVLAAMTDADVTAPDVALVIVKTPIMTLLPATAGQVENKRITSAYSKAIASLGAGLALGEVEERKIVPEVFDVDQSIYARRVMAFSGSELDCIEIMLLANRREQAGGLIVKTGSLRDLLDAPGIRSTLRECGCTLDDNGQVADPQRVVALLAKVGVAPDGRLRTYRTTMKTSHIDMDKHARATVSGVIGSILGSCRVFVSANTVHQAPPGGGLCAVIAPAP